MEKKIFSLKHILLIVVIFTLLFVQVSSEPINYSKETTKMATIKAEPSVVQKRANTVVKKQPASKKSVKTVTPKKYRKNFVIRIPRTVFRPDGPKRITITRTTPPATIDYEIPTHTADETTTYYSTFGYDFISPSPQLSRIFRTKKSPITRAPINKVPLTKVVNNKVPVTKAPNAKNSVPITETFNSQATTPVTMISKKTETVPVTKAP